MRKKEKRVSSFVNNQFDFTLCIIVLILLGIYVIFKDFSRLKNVHRLSLVLPFLVLNFVPKDNGYESKTSLLGSDGDSIDCLFGKQ